MARNESGGDRRATPRKKNHGVGARAATPGTRGAARVLRIVGGRHRGRRLRFPPGVAIRPTPDRVRETLFNWLQMRIDGARVLDLFAGSGALGLEALSRGAAHVTFVERDRAAAAAIRAVIDDWREPAGTVVCDDAMSWLARGASSPPFDVVFIDPPYDSGLLAPSADHLSAPGWLAADARVYVERRAREPLAALPEAWRELRSGRAGEVGYHLFAI